jgi:hypothetical protein
VLLVGAVAGGCSGSSFTGTGPGGGSSGAQGSGASGGSSGGKGSGGSSGSGVGGNAGKGAGGSGNVSGRGGSASGRGGEGGASAGEGGSGNSSGGSGVSGAGTGGSPGGTGGLAGAGGSLGGAGGSGNQGGLGGDAGAECQSDSDCQLVSDCCTCASEPKDEPVVGCDLVCVTDACTAMQIERDEVACVFGRCVLARSCDLSEVGCEAVQPQCSSGTIPSVQGACFGPCLPPTDCARVTNCADCASSSVCVRNETVPLTFGCVTPNQGCEAGSYCDCLGACVNACSENESQVSCSCLGC